MNHLKLRTEYSYKVAFGRAKNVVRKIKNMGATAAGICDRNGTWGHVIWDKECKKNNIKPLFGVELAVVSDTSIKEKLPPNYMSFIAKNNAGLKQIYELTTRSTENFYYIPRIDYSDIEKLTDDIFIFIGENPNWGLLPNKKMYLDLSPTTPIPVYKKCIELGIDAVLVGNNFYCDVEDRGAYEIALNRNKNRRSVPMHIMSEGEIIHHIPEMHPTIDSVFFINQCDVQLPKAEMVHFHCDQSLRQLCEKRAKEKNINLNNSIYKERLDKELNLIKEKNFEDYFYVIWDMLKFAKQHMLVGPARGCFLPDQKVMMANRLKKNIQDIRIGDVVIDAFGQYQKVEETFEYEINEDILDIEFDDGTTISCTPDHEILTHDGWKMADELTKFDAICDVRGNNIKLSKLIQSGWHGPNAHKIKDFGFIEIDDLKGDEPKNSKTKIKFNCEICSSESLVELRRILNRIHGLSMRPICSKCINKQSSNTPAARENNSVAQRKAQGGIEARVNNAISNLKGRVNKYDILFGCNIYKDILREIRGGCCDLCNSNAVDFHHIDFGTISTPDNISCLCKSCHTRIHNYKRYNNPEFNIQNEKIKSIALAISKRIESNEDVTSKEYQAKKILRHCSRLENQQFKQLQH